MEKTWLAVDIGGTAVKYALVSLGCELSERGEFPTPHDGVETLLDAIAGAAEPYRGAIAGIGVSVPGVVREDEGGTVANGGALTYLDGQPFGRLLRERLGLPCALENDGKAAALGEYAAGALKGAHVGVVLVLGTGVGGGIVIDGTLLKGTHLFAGEFSYLYSDPGAWPQPTCHFGVSCGAFGLKARVLAARGLPLTTELSGYEIFGAANDGDEQVIACIRAMAHDVAVQICNLQAILDPDVFAIGGGISRQPLLLTLIHEELAALAKALPPFMHAPEPCVVASISGNDANLIGAAYHGMRAADAGTPAASLAFREEQEEGARR